MKNPEKTDFNLKYFKGMSLKDFTKFWAEQDFIGDPKDYHKKVCGVKKTNKIDS